MLPRLDKFARSILDIVIPFDEDGDGDGNGGGGAAANHSRKRRVLEDVFPILNHWKASTSQCQELQQFMFEIKNTLSKRSHLVNKTSTINEENGSVISGASDEGGDDSSRGSSSYHGTMTLNEILMAVKDLCQLETQLLFQKRSFSEAEKSLALNPEILNNRIVLHFQYLFQVKRLEGVFPKMNELYVFCSEVTSVLRALRSICRLQPNASPKTILVAVQHLLTSDENLKSN